VNLQTGPTRTMTRARHRRRALVALAAVAVVAAGSATPVAQARFQLPVYQPLAPVPILCETIAEWAVDPLAHQLDGEAAYTSLDGADDRIVVSPQICLALLLLALDPAGRHDPLNERPGLVVAWEEAQAALVLEHEVAHATFRSDDETAAACFARAHAADVLTRAGASGARLSTLMGHVAEADRLLGPAYHAHPC
jgi:hypothetical protein